MVFSTAGELKIIVENNTFKECNLCRYIYNLEAPKTNNSVSAPASGYI